MFYGPLHRRHSPTHRLLFVIKPPKVRARAFSAAADWFHADGKAVAAERMHITSFILDDLSEVSEALITQLRHVGAAIALDPFEVTLDRLVGSRQSVALRPSRRNPALSELHRQIAESARVGGVEERQGYRFSPHLTLSYRDGEPFQQRIEPVGWRAEEVMLIHSYLGRTRHEEIGRWPLRGKADPQGSLF